jgi:serine/threonine protein kinase
MTPAAINTSQKSKTPTSALQMSSGANSQLDVQGISGSQVNSAQIGNKYSLLKDLGEGTFGSVKLGKSLETGTLVAVKILEKFRIKDKADIERVVREIKILKRVDHPAFVKLYEIIENSDRIYLIMEYAQGGELFDYIV